MRARSDERCTVRGMLTRRIGLATAAYALLGLAACDDDKPEAVGVTVSAPSGATNEAGGQATFAVVLDVRPSSEVTFSLTSSKPGEGTVGTNSLAFTPTNWAAPQTVTVTGVDDEVADGDQEYDIVFSAATTTDSRYLDVRPESVTLTNTDDDTAGVTVSTVSGATSEAGGQASFTAVLNSQPTADVTLAVESSDAGEGTAAPATLTFTAENWNAPQTVTITGVDDDLADGQQSYEIAFGTAASDDAAYAAIQPASVSVANIDDDTAGVTVGAVSGAISESGGQGSFTVVLNSQPTADVTFALESSDADEGTLAAATLTFTADNWSAPQSVIVTGVDDDLSDGHQPFSVTFTSVSSDDPDYDGSTLPAVALINIDDETADVLVGALSGPTTETGQQATFTITLTAQPTADVTLAIESSDAGEGTVAPGSLTFTPDNWNGPQTVTVTGMNDDLADGHQVYSVVFKGITSDDTDYDGLTLPNVVLTNIDDETASITVGQLSGPTSEPSGTATFSVVLNTQPTADISIALQSSDGSEGSVAPASLTFTADNWRVAQIVTVTGADDDLADGDQPYAVSLSVTSDDTDYNAFSLPNVTLTNIDDETAGITVGQLSGPTSEPSGTATFSVVLTSQPTADVSIALQSSDGGEGSVAASPLSFTPDNWSTAQTVTVTGVDDDLADGNQPFTVSLAVSSADPAYEGFSLANLLLLNLDDDQPGISVSQPSGTTSEAAGQATFTVVLDSEPTADVTIDLKSSDIGEGTLAPTSLTFTPDTWDVAQTVTATGVDDPLVDHAVQYAAVFSPAVSTDPLYSGRTPPPVLLKNIDDETAGITVSAPSGTITTEAAGTQTFSVVLDAQPKADVVLDVGTDDGSEGSVLPTPLTFTVANWSIPQIVTVTGVDDPMVDGVVGYNVVFQAAASLDADFAGITPASIAFTNLDDDVAGISVSAISGPTSESLVQATFTVVLDTQPSADVVIRFDSDDTSEGTVSPTSLTFSSSTWNIAQTVTVSGVDDPLIDGNISYAIVFKPTTSGDSDYDGLTPKDVAVVNLDNEAVSTMTLDAVQRGWWNDAGSHSSSNNNTYTGQTSGNLYNSYFIFDLSGVAGTVVGVELRLELEAYYGSDPSEDATVYDVSTDSNTLENGSGNVAVYTDLQSGNAYGGFTGSLGDVGIVLSIPLNAQSVTDVNAALGGDFSVGVHIDTISGTASQGLRFSGSSEARTHQLVLQIAP